MKKMVILDPQVYESLQKKEQPVDRVLSDLDKKMKDILDSDVIQSEKIKLYEDALQKYLIFQRQQRQAPPPSVVVVEEKKPLSEKELLKPITKKKRASQVLRRLKQNTSTDWNELGELVYDRQAIPSSDVRQLVKAEVEKKNPSLPGWKEFQSVLPKWETLK